MTISVLWFWLFISFDIGYTRLFFLRLGIAQEMVEELSSRGHRTSEEDTRGGAVYGISVRQTDDGVYYEANADYRKGGDVSGFWDCFLFSFKFLLPSTNNNKIAIEWNWMTTFPGNDGDGPQQLLPTMKMNSIFSIDYSILYSSSCLFLLSAFFFLSFVYISSLIRYMFIWINPRKWFPFFIILHTKLNEIVN